MNEQNATMDKIVSVVHENRDFDPIRFWEKIAIFYFESNIITTLVIVICNSIISLNELRKFIKKTTFWIG